MKKFRVVIAMLIILSMTINSVNISYGGGPTEEGNKEQDTIESNNQSLDECIRKVLKSYEIDSNEVSNVVRDKLGMTMLNENEKPEYVYDEREKLYGCIFEKVKSQFNLREKSKCKFDCSIPFIYQVTNSVIKEIHKSTIHIDSDNCIQKNFMNQIKDKKDRESIMYLPGKLVSERDIGYLDYLCLENQKEEKQEESIRLARILLSDDQDEFGKFLAGNQGYLEKGKTNSHNLINLSAGLGAIKIFKSCILLEQIPSIDTYKNAVRGGNHEIIRIVEGYIENNKENKMAAITSAIDVGEIKVCRYVLENISSFDDKCLSKIIDHAWMTCNVILLEALLSNFPMKKQTELSIAERKIFYQSHLGKDKGNSDIIKYFFKKGKLPAKIFFLDAMKKGNEWLMDVFKSIPNYGTEKIEAYVRPCFDSQYKKCGLLNEFKNQRVSDYIDFLKSIGRLHDQTRSCDENTILHLAVLNGELDAVNTLLSNNLDQYKLNSKGLFPISIALENNDERIIVAMLKDILKDENVAISACKMLLELLDENWEQANEFAKTLPEGTLLQMVDIIVNFSVYEENIKYIKWLVDNNVSLETMLRNKETILQLITKKLEFEEVRDLVESCSKLDLNDDGQKELLLKAIEGKNYEIVKFILKKGFNLNRKFVYKGESISPLYLSLKNESAGVLIALLSAGVDIHEKDIFGSNALINAIYYSNESAVNILLENGFHPDEENKEFGSALCLALLSKVEMKNRFCFRMNETIRRKILTLLLKKGADINKITCLGETPWMIASKGPQKVMKIFIECIKEFKKDFDFNEKLLLGSTWLHWLVMNSDVNKMKVLINNGKEIDVNTFNDSKETPLSLAVKKNQTDKAELLLRKGADPNKFHVEPILMRAIFNKNVEIVKLLLKYGADTNLLGSDKISPLVCAVNNPNPEIIQSLIEKGVNIEIPEDKFGRLISIANSQKGNGIMNLILYRFKELPLKYRSSVFMLLILKGSLNDLECFLSNQKIDINVSEKGMLSLLSIAVKGNQIDKVKVLLEKGADTTNCNGVQALNQAISNKNVEIVNLLLQQGININLFDNGQWSPLMIAIKEGNLEIIQKLIQNGAKIEVPKNYFVELLGKAFSPRNEEIIQFLVERYGELPANYKQLLVNEMTSKGEIGDLKKVFFKEVKNSNLVSNALCVAIKNDNVEKVNFLVRYCHAIYYNYLILAIDVGNIEIITTLLDADKKGLLLKSQDGLYCFFYAVKKQDEQDGQNGQNKQVITLFLNKGIDINKKNEYDISAYMLAENQDTKDFLELNGADKVELETTDKHIRFITFFCSNDRTKRFFKSLGMSKSNPLISNLLYVAIKLNRLDKINLLLSPETYNDSDLQNTNTVNALDDINKNLLQYISDMSKECLKILLNKGLGIEQIDSEGNSALHILCESFKKAYFEKNDSVVNKEIDKITLLVEKGCDINIKNKKGQTCLDIVNDTVKDDMTEHIESKNGLRTYDKMIRLLMYNYQKIDSLLNILK